MIAIISDIHGNFIALEEVLKRIDAQGISEIYCLGDTVGYYSQINECCDELRRRNIHCVMGNHDWYLASGTDCERSQSVRKCMHYHRRIISDKNREWILSLPITMNVLGISMLHGGWKNPIDEYVEPSKEYFEKIKGNIFVSGHTHVQRVEQYADKIYCNPGSVGQPRDGDQRAAYAVFDGKQFVLYRVPYDIDQVGRLMEKAGFDSYYYGCLQDGAKNLHR